MTQGSGNNNNIFPAFNGWLVQSLGLQGPPGSCGGAIAATSIDYGPATTCVPGSIQTVDAMLSWIETNIACVLDPASILAAPDGYILVWDAAEGKLVPMTVGAALGSGLPGTSNNDVLLYNTGSMSYVPTSLLTWLDTNLPTALPTAFDAVFPCNTPGQILSCTANGWAATSFRQAFNTSLPGTNNFDLVYWNAGTSSWQTTDAGSVIGNNLPAALAAAYPCTTGDLITCVGGQWQATTFQAAMTSGLPGTTAQDILVWNGAQWIPQEEQTWLVNVLGPALGTQSITALGDTPVALGSPGQVLTTNASSTGTIWTTPDASITTFTGLTDTPAALTPNTFLQVNTTGTGFNSVNICTSLSTCPVSSLQDMPAIGGPLQILRVNALGGAHEYADICAAIANCSITNLMDGPNTLGTADQILKMNAAGTDLEFADFCTQLANCSLSSLSDTPGALGTAGQTLVVNPAGTDLIFADFCAQLTNCSITALTDTPATLGNPGDVFTMNAGGTAAIWSPAATAAGALPVGTAGDIVSYDAVGTTGVARTLPEYLDLYYPPPANVCNAQLTNSGAGWVIAEGIPAPPAAWAFPLAPQSVGLELEVDPATMCAEWVGPSHISGTFQIPGDFPTVQDFITWGSGRSVDVTLNVNAAQPGGINISAAGPSGTIAIRANGVNVGELTLINSPSEVSVEGAVHDSIVVGRSNLTLTNPASINITNGRFGLSTDNAGFVTIFGNTTINGAAESGIAARGSSSVRIIGSLTIGGANTQAQVLVETNSAIQVDEGVQLTNSAGHGAFIDGGAFVTSDDGDVVLSNNAQYGILVSNNGSANLSSATGLVANNNGIDGIGASNGGSVAVLDSPAVLDGNASSGIHCSTGATAIFFADATASNNGNAGFQASGGGQILHSGGLTTQNNQIGISVSTSAAHSVSLPVAININGNNLGILAALGSVVAFNNPAIFAGNVTDTNIPVNALSADGSYINN